MAHSTASRPVGVRPASIPDYLALVGDSADGFPGLPGWGAKSAARVLAAYDHLEQIPTDVSEWKLDVRGASKLVRTLCDHFDEALLFRRIATLEVDVDTGAVRLLRYVIAHDCGPMINPVIVEGQVLGGLACGIGNALLEENVYDEQGQLLTGTLLDYLVPGATEVPDVALWHVSTPSPLNPLGVKGVGEGATVPVPACINNAVSDALGVAVNQTPLTPAKVRAILVEPYRERQTPDFVAGKTGAKVVVLPIMPEGKDYVAFVDGDVRALAKALGSP